MSPPLTPQEIWQEILTLGGELSPQELDAVVTLIRRMLETAAPFLPEKYRLVALLLSVLCEALYRQIGPVASHLPPYCADSGHGEAADGDLRKAHGV